MDGNFDPTTGEVMTAALAMPPAMPPVIAAAIVAVKKQVKQLDADDQNKHGGYNFVSVDKFYAIIGKIMAEAGLALLIDETSTEVRGSDKTGNPWLFAQYTLSFMHETGAMSAGLRRSIALPISGPQAFGAAQSYIEKQFLRQVFKVPTGDKDADDTAPSEGTAPQGRTEARTAQASPPAATAGRGRPQAAPARSPAQEDATKRWNEMRAEIDASTVIAGPNGLDALVACAAWTALDKALRAAEEPEVAANVMQGLIDRIEKRREMLTENGVEAGGY